MDAHSPCDPVLQDVERFLASSQMTPTAFGRLAVNDPTLVHELRNGRDLRRSTRARVLAFIREQTQATEAA